MLNAHPLLAITPESHWIPRLYQERKGLTAEGWVTPGLIPYLFSLPKFTRLGISGEDLQELMGSDSPVSYAQLVSGIFDLYGKAQGKALVGDKTPGYVRTIPLLHKLWNTARFVHLIRDGRDVCLSVANWRKTSLKQPGTFSTWKADPVSTTALWWEAMVRLGREAGKSLGPDRYCEIRYESLVDHPEEGCAALCAFLGLSYDDAMLRFHEGRTRTKPGLDAKHAWLPVTSGLRDWKSQMPTEQVERFESAAGKLLDELGYARAVPRPRLESLERASGIRSLLAEDPAWIENAPYACAEGSSAALGIGVSSSKDSHDGKWMEGRT